MLWSLATSWRYVGMFLQIRNTATETYDDMPSMQARLYLTGIEECEADFGWLKPIDSWNEFVEAAGLQPHITNRRLDDDECSPPCGTPTLRPEP
jgi:hypothetical protein